MPRLRADDGFSVLEMVLVSALSLLALGMVAAVVVSGLRTTGFTQGQSASLDDARTALGRLQRDVHGALGIQQCSPVSSDCLKLLIQTPAGLQQSVKYVRTANRLERFVLDPGTGTYGNPQRLIERVANDAGTPLFSCLVDSSFLRVNVALVVQPTPARSPTYDLHTSLKPRNYLAPPTGCST